MRCVIESLRTCALFSSVAALLGSSGQAYYAAANSCLDPHAGWRWAKGTVGVSVQWGAWAEVGMAAGDAVQARLQASGFELIGLAEGLAALHAATTRQGLGALAVLPARWEVAFGNVGVVPAFTLALAPQHTLDCFWSAFVRASAARRECGVRQRLLSSARSIPRGGARIAAPRVHWGSRCRREPDALSWSRSQVCSR